MVVRLCGLVALASLVSLRPDAFTVRRRTLVVVVSGALIAGLAWLGHAASGLQDQSASPVLRVMAFMCWLQPHGSGGWCRYLCTSIDP